MLVLISPAKTLDYVTPVSVAGVTQARLLDNSQLLIDQLKTFAPQDLASLMKISDPLASLNASRFASWQRPFDTDNAKAAIFAFKGDVYEGLQADTLDAASLDYAQAHLRILSGLYGILRPKDLMQAYRLEMGTKLQNVRGKDLYAFWGTRITEMLNQDLAESGSDMVINLASQEYFKSVQPKQLQARIITPIFKDWRKGQYKIISFYAKRARGLMARYLLQERIDSLDGLLEFEAEAYAYQADLSKHPHEPVFVRRKY
ncbi:MAG: hypothetical protein CR991_08965 [Proteobacteria bacterium]|nr:MAG: hypothetical protein CR991_08965 [Pseudomonadota bacterium]